jgi:RNA polymerase sigma-70 factor (ECF subfamily)
MSSHDPVSPITAFQPADAPAASAGSTLEEIYDRYGTTVYRRARTLLGDPERARDATQEVFLRAAQDLERVTTHPLPWLFRVTTNLCLNNLRDSRRRIRILAGRSSDILLDHATDARLAVSQLLSRVPQDLKEIALHYYVDDLSHEDIASMFGVSRRTIGNRLAAFQALADQLFAPERAA